MTTSTDNPPSLMAKPIPFLNITTAIILWLVLTTTVPLNFVETRPNALGLTILGFNNLNLLIAFCEIQLGKQIKFIEKDYLSLRKQYEGKERKAAFAFLTMPLSLATLFDGQKWAVMWSTYSLWDPSYQNQESFGFFIDVGNGWSTILPNLLWNAAILFPKQVEASYAYAWLILGSIGCASYWQVMYGTIVYFLSYFFNKRHVGRPLADVVGFVSVANGIWIFFPVFALYAAIIILRDQVITEVFR